MTFKLKIKYPNCNLQVGDIVTKEHCLQNNVIPENYPEIWERIEELDYEIMSYIHNNLIYYLKTDGYYRSNCDTSTLYEYNKKTINSIRRLKDNVIFTIGDIVEHVGDICENKFTLRKFELVNNKIKLIGTNLKSIQTFEIPLNIAKHSKQKLFTTNDNVDICKNENYYYIDALYYINYVDYKYNPLMAEEHYKNSTFKMFSNKENAELYVLENKPCLSLNDLRNHLGTSNNDYMTLKQLIKTKL